MKILTLNANLKNVGTYYRAYYFSRELARRGHDVTMVTVSRASRYRARTYYKRGYLEEAAEPGGPGPWVRMVEGPSLGYKWLPGWGAGPLDIWWRTRELWSGDYDLVYGFEYQPNVAWPFYLTRALRRYRFISDWCDWYAGQANWLRGWKTAHRVDALFEEGIRRYADAVTVISKTLGVRTAGIGIDRKRIFHIPNGIDTDYIRDFSMGEVRRRHGFPLDRPILLAVQEGDMARVIRVFQQVLRRVPTALLLVLGTVDGKTKAIAEHLGIGPNICWAGWISESYAEYLGCADVCLLPLRDNLLNQARFPLKLLDYLAAARPVVTNPVAEVGELFASREVGLAAGQSDEELAEASASLLLDPERAAHLGSTARRVMVQEWDWKLRGELIASAVGERTND